MGQPRNGLRKLIDPLVRTDERAWAPLVLRVTLGGVMLPHGAQKLLGWYGGRGWSDTLNVFTQNLHLPASAAAGVVLAETLGAASLVLGLLTRVWAFALMLVMLGAVRYHQDNGFFMNWYGERAAEGFEYHLLAAGLALALTMTGGGRGSVDARLAGTGRVPS